MIKRFSAELLGTFWLVLGGCGTAVLSTYAGDVGSLGVSLAFGLALLTGGYALGHISGGHFNPAVSVGLWVGGRFAAKDLLPYVIAQVLGAILAGWLIVQVAQDSPNFFLEPGSRGAFASNGYGSLSPQGYGLKAAFLCELVLTAMFVIVILGASSARAFSSFAPAVAGLTLTLIHLISIPVTNTSVNPARSTGVAPFAGGEALGQLWLFWVAPVLGAALGGLAYRGLERVRSA